MNKETAVKFLKSIIERAVAAGKSIHLTSIEIEALELSVEILESDNSYVEGIAISAVDAFGAASPVAQLKVDEINQADLPDGQILCVDFGTSFSKAFASVSQGRGRPTIVDLAIGDGSTGTPLTTPSELFIDRGRIYFGVHARKRLNDIEAPSNRLIDSIKQYITLGEDITALYLKSMSSDLDPTGKFSKRDILVLYLAHLTHLTEAALAAKGLSKNVRRRFTHPAWPENERARNEEEMRAMMAEAIILARSSGADLTESMSVVDACNLLKQLGDVDRAKLPFALIDAAVREATAAGAGALLATGEGRREVFLILDIGAGTTDVAGFHCVNNPNKDVPIVSEITSAAGARPTAGNVLDNLFQQHVLEESKLASGTEEYNAAALSIRLGRRAFKENLFRNGSVVVPLPTGGTISVQLDDFLMLPGVIKVNDILRALVAPLAIAAAGASSRINLVATGGGASLPIVRQLVETGVEHEGKRVAFTLVDLLAEGIRVTNPELVEPYPQIAVALGGALPTLPKPVGAMKSGISDAPRRQIGPNYKQ